MNSILDNYKLGQYFAPLSHSQASVRQSVRQTWDTVCATMELYGTDMVLEEIARGRLPAELAAHYNVPLIQFKRWLGENAEAQDYGDALKACAESLVVRAQMALSEGPANAPHASMLRAQADIMMAMAGKMDAATWSNAPERVAIHQRTGGGSLNGQTAIQINILPGPARMLEDGTRASQYIPGFEPDE